MIDETTEQMKSAAVQDLARRLFASWISYQYGYVGVDRTLKQWQNEEIGPYWVYMAELLIADMVQASINMASKYIPHLAEDLILDIIEILKPQPEGMSITDLLEELQKTSGGLISLERLHRTLWHESRKDHPRVVKEGDRVVVKFVN